MFKSILPSNASKLERDLEHATSFPDFPIETLGDLSNPAKIREDLLPWLAYRFGADIWLDDWDEEKRRSVVAKQFDLQRLKGTEAGVAKMLELVDSTLRQTVTFPQRAFASAGITKEQRNAWLARMPEIRVYLATERGTAGADAFASATAFTGAAWARFDSAGAIYGRRAVLRLPDGTETPLRRSSIETETRTFAAVQQDRVYLPGEAGPAMYAGRFVGHVFATIKNKQAKIVTYQLDRSYDAKTSTLHLDTVSPGLEPIDTKYDRIFDRFTSGPALFAGGHPRRSYLIRDVAEFHVFDRVRLHDPTVDVPWSKAHTFANSTRLGMARFRAELQVEARSPALPRAAFMSRSFVSHGFARNEVLAKTKLVYGAVRQAKALRDRVFVDTQTMRPRTFGDGIPMDNSFRFGDLVRKRLD